jgi:DNA-binding sugar fermentation-stimulating protein
MLVEDTLLMKLDNLIEGQIIKRPSLYIKSPYVADVSIDDETNVIAHTASLGCCGLADINATVLLTISSNNKKTMPKNKANLRCTHTIYLSVLKFNNNKYKEQIVGIHPKLAETLVENALNKNLLSKLMNVRRYKRETSIFIKDKVDSRFDFTGVDSDGVPFIMEVKNVPLADYEDVSIVDRKKMDFTGRDINSKVAYFPDGYRKKTTDTVSPRALKHISELTTIKRESAIRCIMCYVIQRTDVNRFQPSVIDPEYRNAFKLALEAGVEIITMVVSWNREGEAVFVKDDLPISI